MAVWLVRAGARGEHQDIALDQGLVVIGWNNMPDPSQCDTSEGNSRGNRVYIFISLPHNMTTGASRGGIE